MARPPRRRASARAQLDGLAVVEHGSRTHNFRIADVSFGGLRLVGDTVGIQVGRLVRVIVTLAVGKRLETCPRLETWAVVQRRGDGEIGLAWSVANPLRAEQIIYLVDDAEAGRPQARVPTA